MARRTATEYLRALQSLLPQGKAWSRDDGSVLSEFLLGQAEEFARVDGRSLDLLDERDTRKTSELLIDHEIDFGLPDECSPDEQTIQERRLEAHGRLIALGQQNPAYYIELAAALGWTIAITEYSAFICGVHGMGDPCGDSDNFFYWKITVTIGGGDIVYFICGGSECGDSLAFLGDIGAVTCAFERYKPAHTQLLWEFDGPEFGYGFGPGFDSLPSLFESYLYGGFGHGFGLGFDVYLGGGFGGGFAIGFRKPM